MVIPATTYESIILNLLRATVKSSGRLPTYMIYFYQFTIALHFDVIPI